MIKPALKDEAFLQDVAAAPANPDILHLWWLGQSGFLLKCDDAHVLLDPYLSDSLTTKYAATDKPHTRMTELVVDPARLSFIDLITSTHNHTDHLDADTLRPILRANPIAFMVAPAANRKMVAERTQLPPASIIGLNDGETLAFPKDIIITALPAAHEKLSTDEKGQHHFLGYIIQLGIWTIYHSGDTILYDGMVDRLRQFDIDIALLPINGRKPERKVDGNLWGREAAQLAHDIGAKLVIPCHYDMFTFNTETPAEFVAESQRLDQPARVLQCGERFSSTEIPA
jgi:L-ascorbate metabolism protein UlaG (beta-lactamase superfamily)